MIDPVSLNPMLSALSGAAAPTAPSAAAQPDAAQFQAVLMQAMGGGMSSGGGLGGEDGPSDPAAELLPLLVQMALAQNPITPAGTGARALTEPQVGTAPSAADVPATDPATDPATGGVPAPEDVE